jgi:Bifunctional DNA primase/polymerase, N-terminal
MSTAVTGDKISNILRILCPALLLPWPARSKGGHWKWKHLELAHMDDSRHLAKLPMVGNIGVVPGKVSDGLVTIDLDHDSYADDFLKANPVLINALRKCGSRGCNIWLRCTGDYPLSHKLKNSAGYEIGEWRADGNQTIIGGTRPEGMPYQFVVETPIITIAYETIIWPRSIVAPHATESKTV